MKTSGRKKIAIIGTGISGLTCGYYLHKQYDVTLFEANDYIGGHTATVDVNLDGREYAIDTGFIVYNDRTYPNFINMMNEIGVEGTPTEMSFSVRNDSNGLEYNGHTVTTLFAQNETGLTQAFTVLFSKFCASISWQSRLRHKSILVSRRWVIFLMNMALASTFPTIISSLWGRQFGHRRWPTCVLFR
nr:FAD-dependent oxidoreductase [Vibrio mytili]